MKYLKDAYTGSCAKNDCLTVERTMGTFIADMLFIFGCKGRSMKRSLILSLFLLVLGCSDDPVKPPPHVTTTFLEVAGTDYTSVTLKLKSTETRENGMYRIARNGVQVWEGMLLADDTLITDTGLTASSDYRYQAFALAGGNVFDSSAVVTAHTKDTSIGDFTWEVIEMGAYPSYLRDVWMISPTDVWAVGKVSFYPSPNNEVIYNALHWDGVKWDTIQVPTTYKYDDGTEIKRRDEDLHSVYAASTNDVWFIGEYGGVCRWRENAWFEMKPLTSQGPGTVRGVWGSGNNLVFSTWGAGIRGWNGTSFYSIKNRNELGGVEAQDVWGIVDTALVIVGDQDHSDGSKVYRVVNGGVTDFPSEGLSRDMSTLWFLRTDMIFAGGARLSVYRDGRWNNFIVDKSWGFIQHCRGNAENDIFAVGDFGTVLHYSGISWQAYSFLFPNRDRQLRAVCYNGADVFIVGSSSYRSAVIVHGKKNK